MTNYLVTDPGPICTGPPPPSVHLAWAVYNGGSISGLVAGNQAPLQIDSAGNLLVNVAVGGGGGSSTVTQGPAGTIAGSWFVAITDGSANVLGVAAHPLRVDPTGTTVQPVSLPASQFDVNSNLIVSDGATPQGTAAWTSATTGGAGGATVAVNCLNYNSIVVALNQGTTITGGVVTFEVSDTLAGTNWYTIFSTRTNSTTIAGTYTLVASTNQGFVANVSGWSQFRLRLSTAISGSGTVNVSVTAQSSPPTFYGGLTVLASGGSTVGKVDILGNAGATLDTAAGTPNSQAITIQGNSSGVAVPVSQGAAAASTAPWYTGFGVPTTGLTTKAAISFSSSGDNTVVALSGSTTIRVWKMMFVVASSTVITIKDSTPTNFSGAMTFFPGGALVLDMDGEPWYIAASGKNFVINSSVAVQVSGTIWYTQS